MQVLTRIALIIMAVPWNTSPPSAAVTSFRVGVSLEVINEQWELLGLLQSPVHSCKQCWTSVSKLYREHPIARDLSHLLCYWGNQGLYFGFLVSLTKETDSEESVRVIFIKIEGKNNRTDKL